MNSHDLFKKDKKMALSFGFMELALNRFMDTVAEKPNWTKAQLVECWNQLSDDSKKVEPKKAEPSKEVKKKVEPKKEEDKKVDPDKCIFKITRGEKMGEQCTSRPKAGQKFCVKHFKPNSDSKEEESEPVEKQLVVKEVVSHSEKMEKDMKSKQEKMEIELKHDHSFVKGTSVVLNKSKAIIGHWDGKKLVEEHNGETDRIQKQYHLSFSKSVLKIDE